MSRLVVVVLMAMVVGCSGHANPDSCTVLCITDEDCLGGQTCGELGRCTSGEACPCSAGEFLGCDGTNLRSCAATPDGIDSRDCGAPGCNVDAQRCNECIPGQATCSDASTISYCGSDGLLARSESCVLGCASASPAHCRYVAPRFLENVCDQPASLTAYTSPSNAILDTSVDTNCTSILTPAVGPQICMIRYRTIDLRGGLHAIGSRALAVIADDSLFVGGIDVSATGVTDGPGGGTTLSGVARSFGGGGGGAGFRLAGGNGGAIAGTGGPPLVPDPAATGFIGGPRSSGAATGGGGGALALVACRGTVTIANGLIVAGGGGGGAGYGNGNDILPRYYGGGGGGAGGFVLIDGARVSLQGAFFANGGAGGGGCDYAIDCIGVAGDDANASTVEALGGTGGGNGGTGGRGGTTTAAGPGGSSSTSPGGGGGASGWVIIDVVELAALTQGTIEASPALVVQGGLPIR